MKGLTTRELWSQLRQRKVVRVALLYLVLSLVAILVATASFEALGFPQWALAALLIVILLGFPVALVLAWAYELTPGGIRRDSAGNIETIKQFDDYPVGVPSIAVLPFEDLSVSGDQAYLAEGLAEEILDTLRKVPGLRVAARGLAFQLGELVDDHEEVGRKLRVQAELKGACRRTGENIMLNVQLVSTTDGTLLWSGEYERPRADIFEIQEEIETSVVRALKVSVDEHRFAPRQVVDSKAYDLFLHGQSCFARHTTQDNVYARQLFKQSIDIEPHFGRAWAALAYTYGYSYMYYNATDVNLAEAKRTSAKALQLAPDLAEPHVASGIACCMDQDYRNAETQFEKAIELDPKNYRAWYFYGRAKVQEGDLPRALKLFERASRVRPEDFQSVLLQAQLYTSLNQKIKALEVTREGIERVRAVLELNPEDNRALNMGAFALLRLGQTKEAVKWMAKSLKNAPMDSIIQYNGACFYSLAGDEERALDCLEHCLIKVGNINREWLEHDSDMDNIRNHPRYGQIISSFPE